MVVDEAVLNNSKILARDLGIGDYEVLVRYDGEVIASGEFGVITSYDDVIDVVAMFYKEGEIKNFGLAISTVVDIKLAEVFDGADRESMADKFLQMAIDFLQRAGEAKKPKITNYALQILLECLEYLKIN